MRGRRISYSIISTSLRGCEGSTYVMMKESEVSPVLIDALTNVRIGLMLSSSWLVGLVKCCHLVG